MGIYHTTNIIEPAKIPYKSPFNGLLMFKILLLYKNIPVTIPIDVAVIRCIVIPATAAKGEKTPITCPKTIYII
jgi:hypothetical protein